MLGDLQNVNTFIQNAAGNRVKQCEIFNWKNEITIGSAAKDTNFEKIENR